MNQNTNTDTLRKWNHREGETNEQRLKRENEAKRNKRANETEEAREARLESMRERRSRNKKNENAKEREQCQNREKEHKRATRARKKGTNQNTKRIKVQKEHTAHQNEDDSEPAHQSEDVSEPTTNSDATTISEEEHRILQGFRDKMDNISYKVCSICNERIPCMILINNITCRRCHTEKHVPKKFSADNNMDPGEVPDELKGLTEIEEMLIA